jgi:outer membrane protein assembly factor BamB
MDGLVIVTTNAKTAVAYEALSGKLAWKQKLDGSAIYGPLVHQGSVVAVSDSLYLLSPAGKIQRRFSWKNERAFQADSTPRRIVVVTLWPKSAGRGAEEPGGTEPSKLRLLEAKSGAQRTTALGERFASVRYAPNTRLLYLSRWSGVDLIHAEKGTLLCQLKTGSDTRGGLAHVDVRDKKIYVLTDDGSVHALRHPVSKSLGLVEYRARALRTML